MIRVEIIDDTTFSVTVKGRITTDHRVTVDRRYYQKLTGGRVSPQKLVEKSFEFLLERESNTHILASFDLPVIGQYFPEYEQVIKTYLERS